MTEQPIGRGGEPATGRRSTGLLGAAATLFGGGAVFVSSCCIVPLSLAALGATGAVSGWIDAFALYQPYFLGLTGLALGGGWLMFLRQSKASCAVDGTCVEPAARRRGVLILVIASAIAVLAFGREYIEPIVVTQLLGGA